MSFKTALIVYRKELLEMLRDKRTLFTTILLPVILYPLIFVGISALMSRQMSVLERQGAIVAVADSVANSSSAIILKHVEGIEHFQFMEYSQTSQELYQSKDVHAILTISDSLTTDNLQTYKISIQFDKSTDRGQLIQARLTAALSKAEKEILEKALTDMNIDSAILSIVSVQEIDTATQEREMGMLLGKFMPYLLIMMLMAGASIVASDLVAGEKERKTLETLLVSAAHRNELVLGKYLTVITFALLNVMINLFSLYFSMRYMLSQSGLETAGISFPLKGFVILLLAITPLATLFAAVMLSISTFSRNMKEARTYEAPMLYLAMFAGMITFFPAIEISNGMALIPVVNIALFFKAVLMNEYQLTHLFLIMFSTLLLDFFAILVSIKLFNSEAVLFRTDDDSSLKNVKKDKRNLFNPFYGMVYFVLALLALYYIGSSLQAKDLAKGLFQTQVFIIVAPVLLVLSIFKLKPKEILRIKAPKLKELILIPFITIPATIIVSMIGSLINYIYPFPAEYLEKLMELFKLDASLWKSFLIIAVTPGVCEEIMFRGFLMRFYENNGKTTAVVISALLFAAFHLDPFRFIPVFILGLLLGYLTIRSGSIVNSMIAHTLNNGLALFIATYSGAAWMQILLKDSDNLQPWVIVPALILFTGSILAFHKITAPKEI